MFDTYGRRQTPRKPSSRTGSRRSRTNTETKKKKKKKRAKSRATRCVIPGSWFWEASGRQTEAETRADASNALSLLAREKLYAGASHRSAVLGPRRRGRGARDVDIALRASSASKPVGDAALRWCAAATATRAELFLVARESLETSRPKREAFRRAPRVKAGPRASCTRLGRTSLRKRARARRAIARLVAAPGKLPVLRQRAVARVRGGARAARPPKAGLLGTEPVRDRAGSPSRAERPPKRAMGASRPGTPRRRSCWCRRRGRCAQRSKRSWGGREPASRRVRRFGVFVARAVSFHRKKRSRPSSRGRESQLLRREIADSRNARAGLAGTELARKDHLRRVSRRVPARLRHNRASRSEHAHHAKRFPCHRLARRAAALRARAHRARARRRSARPRTRKRPSPRRSRASREASRSARRRFP